MSDKACCCNSSPSLIFSCSGGSDVGELSDQVSRRLTQKGVGKMYCLAGIGGSVSGIIATTEAAEKILALDGCPLDCAKKTLEEKGFKEFIHLRMSDLGLIKGKSPVNEANISVVAIKAQELLR